jgi:hypothetical protein
MYPRWLIGVTGLICFFPLNKNNVIISQDLLLYVYRYPLVAVRNDKKGVVTSITFSSGAQEDAMKMVVNALIYQKEKF